MADEPTPTAAEALATAQTALAAAEAAVAAAVTAETPVPPAAPETKYLAVPGALGPTAINGA